LNPTQTYSTKPASFVPRVSHARTFIHLGVNLILALAAGLGLRLFFITHISPFTGDTKFYEELAKNWLYHGVYGLFVNGQLLPVDMRMPGYPAFLAAIYAVFGRCSKAILYVQAAVDLATCVLAALIAARLAPEHKRKLVAIIALWLAALCPFTASYSAVVLTEVLATFLTTLALLMFAFVLSDPDMQRPLDSFDGKSPLSFVGWFLFGGIIVGVGTLVRPEAPLLLIAVGLVLVVRLRGRADWSKLMLAISWMAVGLLIPLTPWAARNARTMGRIEFLAPRFAETNGDFIPRGFYEWTRTWMTKFGEAYLVPWKLDKAPIRIDTLPDSAFDSAAERAHVETLLSRYNSDLDMSPVLDREFAQLARERTARHPMRTYFFIPISRAWMMWFTPRIELLPYSGKLWPPGDYWRGNPTDFGVTLGYGILTCIYLGLALVGAWRCRKHPSLALFVTFILIRTAFLTQLQTVEPRYVVVSFPAILAIGAVAFAIAGRAIGANGVQQTQKSAVTANP
jgi:4-amino-4-deoxy-L-arabinose transferase-like glycosyltransferase